MRVSRKIKLAIMAGAMCALLVLGGIGIYAMVDRTKQRVKISQVYLEKTAGAHLQKKIDLMLSTCQKTSSDFEQGSEEAIIAKHRETMASLGETYSKSRTFFKIIEQNFKDNKLYVVATENTLLMMDKVGFETGYAAKHRFAYKFQKGTWNLISDEQLEPSGLMPLQDAYKFVVEANQEPYKSWFSGTPKK